MGKRGKNPGAVDQWLDTLGLYRKNVAYDETCLFRAISEQLHDCQVHHERVRRDCLTFARQYYKELSGDFDSPEKFLDHLDKLEKHMVICGNIELKIISARYNRGVTIFDAASQKIYNLSDEKFDKSFLLCIMDRDHYDVVYNKDHILTAGFCQSIVYKILYEDIFGIQNVDDIVHNMLYDKGNIITQAELMMEKKRIIKESETEDLTNEELDEKLFNINPIASIAPFPFKIAKALDPNIYRNIEYDSWGETRRELRLGEWYYGDDKLILGTKCIFNDMNGDEKYECYIQEMIKDQNQCVVYITKLAQKRTVNYTDLSPEDDAKPWPLPYRFSKSVVITPTSPTSDRNNSKTKKRNTKEKKRTKSESSVMSAGAVVKHEPIENIEAYVGIPLQMQSQNTTENISFTQTEPLSEGIGELTGSQDVVATIERENETSDNATWCQSGYHWPQYMTPAGDPFIWPTHSDHNQSMYNYNMKPMVASAPVTPSVIPYHDVNYPYYYNYHVEATQSYPQWSSPPFELQAPPPPKNQQKVQEQENIEVLQNYHETPQHMLKVEVNNNCDPKMTDSRLSENLMVNYVQQPETPIATERPVVNYAAQGEMGVYAQHGNPCTPVEMYPTMSPVLQMPQMPPGTPILYSSTTALTPEITEVLVPTTPVIYTPSVEVSYVQPTHYIYPPTPPPSWYASPVTTQGFIFPQRP
ncbi:unnamed protein product [Diabrotica balteata]|uniref:OTU domain-containing protein n=1 Tax=Diabrotica balteata TaxID=107213 RepID=A0A9N9XBQ4_DIABA|nr:unnamed protein product [Diabrotica balteata]